MIQKLIWNPVFIWFSHLFLRLLDWAFFHVTITWKTAKCANMCQRFRQKHDSQIVINFNQFHSPLESCQEWNLSLFHVCSNESKDPIINSKLWQEICLPIQKVVPDFLFTYFNLIHILLLDIYFALNIKRDQWIENTYWFYI